MSDEEEKPMLITQDLLEQVLRNQCMIMQVMEKPHLRVHLHMKLEETEALLERLE